MYLVAKVGKSPYISQINSEANDRKQEIQVIIPCNSIIVLVA